MAFLKILYAFIGGITLGCLAILILMLVGCFYAACAFVDWLDKMERTSEEASRSVGRTPPN